MPAIKLKTMMMMSASIATIAFALSTSVNAQSGANTQPGFTLA